MAGADEAPQSSLGYNQIGHGLSAAIGCPSALSDPVARQDGPGAIGAAAAVDEHRPAVAVFQNVQDLETCSSVGALMPFMGTLTKRIPSASTICFS